MAKITELERFREQGFFEGWDEFVATEHVKASEASVQVLVEELLSLGPGLSEETARQAVDQCVRRFNDIDDGWICTIERDDIFEQIAHVVDACGFDCQEDWINERDW